MAPRCCVFLLFSDGSIGCKSLLEKDPSKSGTAVLAVVAASAPDLPGLCSEVSPG